MNIGTILDLAIKKAELGQTDETKAYEINGRRYENYIDNETWQRFVNEMKDKYPEAYSEYGDGAGDELGIKKVGKYPPKMASYGSSSRMIYLLSRDIPGFCFEKKLPTTVGGIAHMDGYIHLDGKDTYIEAKCREPYSSHNNVIDRKYEDLYRYIDSSQEVNLRCEISPIDAEKMSVRFIANEVEITRFDIKQMISHLLGIATSHIKCPNDNEIRFLYLLYNPKLICVESDKYRQQLYSIYEAETKECDSIPFPPLLKTILRYLLEKKLNSPNAVDIDQVVNRFSFKRCDQETYHNCIK